MGDLPLLFLAAAAAKRAGCVAAISATSCADWWEPSSGEEERAAVRRAGGMVDRDAVLGSSLLEFLRPPISAPADLGSGLVYILQSVVRCKLRTWAERG